MKLKKRLLIAFCIMTLTPVILIYFSVKTIANYQMKSIHSSYDIQTNAMEVISNPIQVLNKITRGAYNEIKLAALKTPEKLEDIEFAKELNDKLDKEYSFVVLRINNEYKFVGDEKKLQRIGEALPEFGVYDFIVDGGIYLGGKSPYLIKMQDFYTKNNEEATIFVLTHLGNVMPQIRGIAIQSMVAFFSILVITSAVLVYGIYHSILRPLNILIIATNHIKEGDLEKKVQYSGTDEIGVLCTDFEEMRIKLKELIEVKQENEEEIKEIISNISHDLKTPLTAIKGYSEGILDGVADTDEKMDKYIKTIYMKANEMQTLVDELSFYSKIDNNTRFYKFKDINIHEYFADCIEEIKFDLEKMNFNIIYENKLDSSAKAIADAEQLKRVINNIMGNSVKYSDKEQGEVIITIDEDGKWINISIQDNGKGIAEADLPHIFSRFYRGDLSRGTQMGGSGLGLAIVEKIVKDHGGYAWVTSEEGKGTRVSFTLLKASEDKKGKYNEENFNN